MKYFCNHCFSEIPELQTPGEEINTDFTCPKCAKEMDNLLRSAREIQRSLQSYIKQFT